MAERAFYEETFIDLLNERANLVHIAEYLGLKIQKSGRTWKANCPFHADKSPSFHIFPSSGKGMNFQCFGCGAGTRSSHISNQYTVSFVRHMLNISVQDAVEWVAASIGEALPPLDPKAQKEYENKKKVAQQNIDHHLRYVDRLYEHPEVLQYLYDRGFGTEDIQKFGLGFGDELGDKKLANRIVFPIYDQSRIVGFSGRKLPDTEGDKYLNTYGLTKTDYLYGLHFASPFIGDSRAAVVVEGFTDVIMLHKCKLNHAVGTLGTSLSENQVKLLKRHGAQVVIFVPDDDEAGYKKLENNILLVQKYGMIPYVFALHSGMDPCDWGKSFNISKYADIIILDTEQALKEFHAKKIPYHQWRYHQVMLDSLDKVRYHQEQVFHHQSQIHMERSERVKYVIHILSQVIDPSFYEWLLHQAAEDLGLSAENITKQIEHYKEHQTYLVS